MATEKLVSEHHVLVDLVRTRPRRVLLVVANPAVSTTLGWPVGFWAAELTHPYYELTERGIEVTIASPDGGKVEIDGYSDPARPVEVVGRGPDLDGLHQHPGVHGPARGTPRLADLDSDGYDALMVAGGQSPMFTFRDNEDLQGGGPRTSTRPRSPPPSTATATAALVDVRLVRRLLPGRGQDGHRLLQRGGGLRRRVRRPEDHALADRGRAARARRQLRPRRSVQGVRRARPEADHRPAAVLGPEGRPR